MAARRAHSRRFWSSALSRPRSWPSTWPRTRAYATLRDSSGALRAAFDQPSQRVNWPSANATGLLGYAQLRTPHDLVDAALLTQAQSQGLVEVICDPSLNPTVDPRAVFLRLVRLFDRLSDALCKAIDLSEAVRNVHPSDDWVAAAEAVHEMLTSYMNTLNTHVGLYECLDRAYKALPAGDDPSLFAARAVALQFLRDFRRHGIHLDAETRSHLVRLSDRISKLGRQFLNGATDTWPVEVSRAQVSGVGRSILPRIDFDSRGLARIDPNSWEAAVLARQHPDENVRRRVWIAQNTAPESQIELLQGLLQARAEFASLTGKLSWSHMVLEDKMIGTPENVDVFLRGVASALRPQALEEVAALAAAKGRHLSTPHEPLSPWDHDYYAAQSAPARPSGGENLAPYFSVGTCVEGLSKLCSSLFGITFLPEECPLGEAWHPSVRKLGVFEESAGRIGTIFCDLYSRPGKPVGAAHYTVLCSRRIDWDHEPVQADATMIDATSASDALKAPPDAATKAMQLPIVVLSCDFAAESSDRPTLLSWQEVETLWHEMGHALHSMIGRTDYHNVAGTRCPTDLVEVPSILMEQFLASEPVLRDFARHYRDGRSVPDHILKARNFGRPERSALESNTQIVMAMADQALHSSKAGDHPIDSTRVWNSILHRYGAFPSAPDTTWHGRFGHLVGYGASYYAYLFDRLLANHIWQRLFRSRPLDREMGERYKTELLRWGGGKDSWECLGSLLQDDVVKGGGQEALKSLTSPPTDVLQL